MTGFRSQLLKLKKISSMSDFVHWVGYLSEWQHCIIIFNLIEVFWCKYSLVVYDKNQLPVEKWVKFTCTVFIQSLAVLKQNLFENVLF